MLDAVRRSFLSQINTARAEAGRSPLRLSEELGRAAQARADEIAARGDADDLMLPGDRILAATLRAGYEADTLLHVVAEGEGDPPTVVASWRERKDGTWKDVLDERMRDLGVGSAWLDREPLYVLILGISSRDGFALKTEGLRDAARVRAEMLATVNRERAAHNVPPVRENAVLQAAAQGHADDMLARCYYGHDSPDGDAPLARAKRAGYDPQRIGENIARGQTSVAQVMENWMASPGHRENILNPAFEDAGFGFALGRLRDGYEVIWVQAFGKLLPP